MKDITWSASSSSSWSGEEDEEEEEDYMMTMPRFFSITPKTHNSKVALDHIEAPTSQKRALADKSCALERAKEVKANLDNGFPSFVKTMQPSYVSGDFRMYVPQQFGNTYLPNQIAMITLIDENQEEYSVKYLASKVAFSLGWKEFSIAHKLVEGDALVFQLVKPTEFQVYIIRAYHLGVFDRVVSPGKGPCIPTGKRNKTSEKTEERGRKNLPLDALQQPGGRTSRSGSEEIGSEIANGIRFSRPTGSEEIGSEVANEIRFSKPTVNFQDIENLESFTIAVNGMIIDSELSDQARSKYYELCCSQKALLHENLIEAINCSLAAGFISQTTNIADSIKASKLSTTRDEFAAWDTNLGAFEQLGMNVGFLRARIKELVRLNFDSERYRDAIGARENMKKETISTKAKLIELEKASKMLDTEIETLKMKAELQESKLRAEVDAPW